MRKQAVKRIGCHFQYFLGTRDDRPGRADRRAGAGSAGDAAAGGGERVAYGVSAGSGATINVVCADVAKDVDAFPGLRILFDVECEDILERNVAFPDVRMPLHLAYTQRWMERWVFCAILEAEKRSLVRSLMSAGSAAYASQKVWIGRNFIVGPGTRSYRLSLSKVCTRPSAMARVHGTLLLLPLRRPEIGLLGWQCAGHPGSPPERNAWRRAARPASQGFTDDVVLIGWHSHDQLGRRALAVSRRTLDW